MKPIKRQHQQSVARALLKGYFEGLIKEEKKRKKKNKISDKTHNIIKVTR